MWLFSRPKTAILVVCTANICRSPMGAAMLRYELEKQGLLGGIKVDSAGTHATQPGRGADPRARQLCAREGIDLGKCRARQFKEDDYSRFGYILAMDRRNQQWLLERCPETFRQRISPMGGWAAGDNVVDIPDPYYGNLAGFEQVFTMLQDSVRGFLTHLAGEAEAAKHGAQ